jgi:pimeloyl-ACP methyl ester carboxylesterase
LSLLFEATALLCFTGALLLVARGLRRLLRWLRPPRRSGQTLLVQTLYGITLFLFAVPLVLATLQMHPQRISNRHGPERFGLDFESVRFHADGLELSGWYIPASDAERPVVLVAHGFNANKGNFLPAARLLHELGYAVFLFDFRGHGESAGRTVTLGAREALDVKAAHDWIARRFPGRTVHALGYSMGGAAVIAAAAQHGLFRRIALDSSFHSAEGVARATLLAPLGPLATPLWNLGCFWGWLWSGVDLREHRPGRLIPELAGKPLLLIHGKADGIIPYTETLLLHRASQERAELWLVENARHAESIQHREYPARLRRFFGD